MNIFFVILNFFVSSSEPVAQVDIDTAEVEAVFVPEGYTGPVVAVPFDEAVF